MKVAVIGAGGIGAVIATAAASSGHDVTVCVRTPFDSLVLVRNGEDVTPDVTLAAEPEGVDPAPWPLVWLTTKAQDTAGAAPWLARLTGPGSLVVAAQNGLDHEARLAPYVRPGTRVVPCVAYLAAERLAPGRVRHLAGDRLYVPNDVAPTLAGVLGGGGLVVRGVDDMTTSTWRKLLSNLVANPITALTRRRIGVMREPGIADMARAILSEALAVGRAEGAVLADSEVEGVIAATDQYGEETGSSMYYDRMAGRPMEHQYLTGEVVRRGQAWGLAVPMNAAVLALLEAIERGQGSDG